jgi:hypothetical protein
MKHRLLRFSGAALLALMIVGCSGDDGAQGPAGPTGPTGPAGPAGQDATASPLAAANPETCVLCHSGTGAVARTGPGHEDVYKQFYQDGVAKVSNITFTSNGTDTATLTFKLTENGQPLDCSQAVYSGTSNPTGTFAIGSYWAEYDATTKSFPSDQSLVGTKSYDAGTMTCTITKTGLSAAVATKMQGNGIVQIYGVDGILETNDAAHTLSGKYPFAGVLKIGTVDYSSAANVSGCENCHTKPFLKHTYIYGKVTDNDGNPTEFYTCKGCHYDTRDGHDLNWQIKKDDPARYAEIVGGSPLTAEETAKYAYKAKLMNDVHMSHAMEFAYPQSMRNCVTCHAGKLDQVLADAKFVPETCKSCHAVDGLKAKMTAATFPHATIVDNLNSTDPTVCTVCHKTGGAGPTFATIHKGGYDPLIYTSTGVRYADAFVAKIDTASLSADNKLTVSFSATEAPDIAGMSVDNITPTVMVGLYGYNSKDFIVAAHGRDADGNRLLEWTVGSTNPRFTLDSSGSGTWTVTVDLSMWADQIASGVIKRAEVAVRPALKDPNGLTVGLNAPSRTFDLTTNAFDDTYFPDIVKVVNGCNTCHDQLATTFHSGDRGGNIRVCRICHEVSNGASHLPDQSRSIDSYVHAIHSFQVFDPKNIDFGNPVESLEYQEHVSTEFPRFGILDCQSCHNPGMNNVPNQAKSMPGVLSGIDAITEADGNVVSVGDYPSSVTGPAVRACGACHRAQKINAGDPAGLAVLTSHFKTFGYVIDNADGVWEAVVAKIMAMFSS